MNVSLAWLNGILGTRLTAAEASTRLAMLGAPVDGMERTHAELEDVIVAAVESVRSHPDADRLSLCTVNTGSEVLEVVCGAPNVAAGKRYPYAPVGATLPGGFKLAKRKIRGVVSNGMLCSARELGLGEDHEGIMELPDQLAIGAPFVSAAGMDDVCLEVDVTPNRPDLLGHKGVARDLGAALGVPVKLEPIPNAPAETLAPVRSELSGSVGGVDVTIDDPLGCPRYLAAVVRGVKIGPSPDWLQRRLRAIGQRPINNVVDATNYMLQELSQPMHAFDLDRLRGGKIVVRRARAGEKLVTLDGAERVLTLDMTGICDAEGPVAIGGVMGGADSEVTDQTTTVLLECAYFDPRRIRATRTALKMSTDASFRYERGTDHQAMPEALRRGVAMIIAVAGGEEAGAPVDVYPVPITMPTVFLRPDRVAHLLGVTVPREEIEAILTRLGFAVAPKDTRLAVQAPGWRPDVTREVDLIEEVARVRGYDSFAAAARPFRASNVPDEPMELTKAQCRTLLAGFGLHEARSSALGPETGAHAQPVVLPLSVEEGFLRTDLMTGLLRSAERNWSVRVRDIRLFEIGAVFHRTGPDSLPREMVRVAGIISGARHPGHWADGATADFDRWDAKGIFETLVRQFGAGGTTGGDGDRLVLVDGKGAERGWAGPVTADAPAWAAAVWGFELDLVGGKRQPVSYGTLPDTPAVERDVALILPAGVTAGEVEELIREKGGGTFETLSLFDEYRGDGIDGRSVAWRLVFRSRERTLRDTEVDKAVARILTALKERLRVELREA